MEAFSLQMTREEEEKEKEEPQPEIVELATLALPPTAIETGLEAGEGNQVVLEASHDVVEHIHTEMEHTYISGIVDLEKLSELVGVSEEEFITGLHHEVHEHRADEAGAVETEEEIAFDEETSLIPSERESKEATEQITLDADPFIETLAEALTCVPEEAELDAVTEAAATTTEDEHHLAHDAFLLDLPTEGAEGKLEHRYVLALPEIHVAASVTTASSALSGETIPFLERASSILPATTHLPTDIKAVHLEVTEQVPTKADPSEVHLDIVVDRRVPLIGYIILFAGLFALASVGAALDLQQGGVTAAMKTLWRQTATCVALSPLVVKSLLQDGLPQLSRQQLALLPVSAAAYAYMTLAFVVALDMTTLANAFVLSNMTSLVIIAGRAVLGLPVLLAEGVGAATGFLGAAICADDASKTISAGDADHSNPILGNIISLSASFGTAAYLIIAKSLRSSMDLFVFMFAIMGLGSFMVLAFVILSGENVTFDMHPVHGIFGWLNLSPDRLPLEMYMAVVCNCLGTTGYIAVMKYFAPLVPATVMLLEPVVGALLGTAAGTAPLPGLQTWFGDLVVAAGTFLVIWAGASKTESINATKALRPRHGSVQDLVTKSPLVRKSPMINRKDARTGRHSEPHVKVIWESNEESLELPFPRVE